MVKTPLDLRYVRHPVAYGLHPDATPSLQLYGDNSFYCFGCHAGGSIYDFAARLWGQVTKGRAFIELRERLLEELGLNTAREVRRSAHITPA